MKWQIWQRAVQWRVSRKALVMAYETLERENRELLAAVDRLRFVYQRTPAMVSEAQQGRANLERLLSLAGISAEHPLWKTVLSYADEHERNEAETALRPGLNDGDRQYNAGRAASARDFASALRDLWVEAQRKSKRG